MRGGGQLSTTEKSLSTKGQAETILSQKRMLKLLQFKMELIAMDSGLSGAIQELLDAYTNLSKCIDHTISLEANRHERSTT